MLDGPTVRLAISHDGGSQFNRVIAIDQGQPVGRPAVAILEDDSTLVCWLRRGEGHSELRSARVMKDGRIAEQRTIAKVAPGRASGFPRVAAHGRFAILCWTSDAPSGSNVLAVRISIPQ